MLARPLHRLGDDRGQIDLVDVDVGRLGLLCRQLQDVRTHGFFDEARQVALASPALAGEVYAH